MDKQKWTLKKKNELHVIYAYRGRKQPERMAKEQTKK